MIAPDPLRTVKSSRLGLIDMPYFRVLMNGEGISVSSSGDQITGFYATRWVKADKSEEAKDMAKKLVLSDWADGEYAEINEGDAPRLSVDSIVPVGFLSYLWNQPGKGHSFYSPE